MTLDSCQTLALEVEILGPSGGTLAPNTEYGFGVWIRNPEAWVADSIPTLDLQFSIDKAISTDYGRGTFENVTGALGSFTWYSNELPCQKGLVGYICLRTGGSGQLTLLLDGSIGPPIPPIPATGYDERTYTIATLSGDCWLELRDLANSRALTNGDLASLYTSLVNNDTPPVSGYELFSGLSESQKNALHGAQLAAIMLEGLLDPAGGISSVSPSQKKYHNFLKYQVVIFGISQSI